MVSPCNVCWSDIGSLDVLGNLTPEGNQGNRVDGIALLQDVTHCYLKMDKRLIASVGIYNLVIVDTPGAQLIDEKCHEQDV